MSQCVVAFRLNTGEEMMGILVGVLDGVVKMEHPYYVTVNTLLGSVAMSPYCALTDETYFEFKEDQVTYLVTARDDIAIKFLNTIDEVEYRKTEAKIEELSQPDLVDEIEAMLRGKTYMQGNTTRH